MDERTIEEIKALREWVREREEEQWMINTWCGRIELIGLVIIKFLNSLTISKKLRRLYEKLVD